MFGDAKHHKEKNRERAGNENHYWGKEAMTSIGYSAWEYCG